MGYTTKVLALKRKGLGRWRVLLAQGYLSGSVAGFGTPRIREMFPAITDLNDLLGSQYGSSLPCARFLFCSAWRRRCFGLFRLIWNFRAEGKTRCLARRMLDVVGSSFLLLITCGCRPPQE